MKTMPTRTPSPSPRIGLALLLAWGLGLSLGPDADLAAEADEAAATAGTTASPSNPTVATPMAAPPVAGRPASAPLLSGAFTQEKTIAGLKKPLISSGDFLVARDKGVIWRTRKPISAAVAVTPKGIWSLKQSGTGKAGMGGGDLKREPVHQGNLGMAMDMIQKVLSGNPASLKKLFAVRESGDTAAWTLDLKPLDPVVQRVILSIRLQGGAHVERVEYAEANGDKTRIAFSQVADNAGELASWQAIAFRD